MEKKQFSTIPDFLRDRQWWGFDWLEHVTAVPAPLALVTGYKKNGKANGTMQSWFCFSNENGFYCIFGSVDKHTHMYEIATEKKQLVINFPDKSCIKECMDTINNNGYETDELTASGLSYIEGTAVNAPVVNECFLNLECEFAWEKPLFEGSNAYVLCVRVVNVHLDTERYDMEAGRYGENGYLYNIHCPLNPETGESSHTQWGVITPGEINEL